MAHFKIVLPNGEIEYVDRNCDGDPYWRDWTYESMCKEVATKHNYTTCRKNPTDITAKLYRVTLKNGTPTEWLVKDVEFTPQLERLDAEVYEEEMSKITKDLPEEFADFIKHESWQRGHSAGYDSACDEARDLIEIFTPCLERYNRRKGIKPDGHK